VTSRGATRKWRSFLAWGLGGAVLAYVLAQPDYPALFGLLQNAGFTLLWVLWLEPLRWVSQAAAWQLLFAPGHRARFASVFYASALANAVNELLPTLAVGGNLLKARHLVRRGVSGVQATAAGIVDISLHGVSALGWSLIGLSALSALVQDAELFRASLVGSLILGLVMLGFIGAQLFASNYLAGVLQNRFSARGWDGLARSAEPTQRLLLEIWQKRSICLGSVLLRMAGRALMVPEMLFVGWLMGADIAFWQATAVTGLVILVKTASFMIPARIGVQEGAFLAAGALLGLQTEVMFALALAVRMREVLPQLPILLIMWFDESRRLS